MLAKGGGDLVGELLADPSRFNDRGRAYDLLQAYFSGFSIETLRPLLRHADPLVRRAAVFVASELGSQACGVVDDVLPLLESGDRYLQYHAMEVAILCCEGDRASDFSRVVLFLEASDPVLRALAMRLVLNAHPSQLRAARSVLAAYRSHAKGLDLLTAGECVQSAAVAELVQDPDPLCRRYGALAARHYSQRFPELAELVVASGDPELVKFSEDDEVK